VLPKPKLLLHTLILSSYLIFFGSMLISARSYYSGRPIKLRDAMISGLLAPSDNPHGYGIARTGTALCGALLLPVAFMFYRALSRRSRPLAMVGALIFALGPVSAISIVFFANDIDDLHVYLAFAAYIFMTSGVLICLALEVSPIVRAGGMRAISMLLVPLFLLAVLIFLVYLLFTPDYFDDKSLLRNVAFCEWTLCCILAAGISGLAVMLSRPTR
jgi:hypothetical protein